MTAFRTGREAAAAMRRYLGLFTILLWAPAARAADLPRYQYSIETVAGSSLNGDGGPATAAQIGAIQGIALDGAGNLYLSDTDHNSVRKVDSKGIITTVAGTGTAGFGGDGAAATSALLNLPYGLAADSSGALYVADLGNNRVRRIGPDGVISTVAGTGTAGSAGDGGPATDAQLMAPRNLVVDASGNLYISEFEGHRVRKVSNGQIVTVAGTGVAGFRGDGGTAVAAQLDFPAGLALDQTGDLYIADSENQRIRKVLPNGIISTALGGSPSIALYTPLGVAVDASGDILVGDASYTVRAYTPAGKWSIVAGTGAPGYAGDGGPAVGALLTSVRDLAAAAGGRLYIADGVRVRCVDDSGTIWTAAGDGYLHAIGDGASALAANLSGPSAVALDFAGNLYIADPGTQRVRKVDSNNVIQTLAGTGAAGGGGELVPGIVSALNTPMGVAVDPSGIVYIADTYNHRIRAVSADGRISTVAGTGNPGTGAEGQPWTLTPLRGPRGVTVDRKGTLYIVDTGNHRVLRAAPGANMATAAGNGSPGDAGDGGPLALRNSTSRAPARWIPPGDLFIADTLNHRIRKVRPAGVSSPRLRAPDSQAHPETKGPPRPPASTLLPASTADDNGNVFIADTGNHVIRQVTADAVIHLIAGQYTAGFAGDGAAATSAQLDAPAGLVLDGAGDLYLADSGNNRVRRLVPGPCPGGAGDPTASRLRSERRQPAGGAGGSRRGRDHPRLGSGTGFRCEFGVRCQRSPAHQPGRRRGALRWRGRTPHLRTSRPSHRPSSLYLSR